MQLKGPLISCLLQMTFSSLLDVTSLYESINYQLCELRENTAHKADPPLLFH